MIPAQLFSSLAYASLFIVLHAGCCDAVLNFTQGIVPVTDTFLSQWRNPNDVLSLLLIIGGDVVQKALAQLSGGYFVPVTFSFGWVAYSFSALMAVFGDGRIMPLPDCPSILVNARSGYARPNQSWVLGRILRDFEENCDCALKVVVFEAKWHSSRRDWIWYGGISTMIVQCVIAMIPFICQGNWVILTVTIIGTALACCDGALPQWRSEKWSGRTGLPKTVCLTRGNGSQHVMVIINKGGGTDLEDLASSRVDTAHHTRAFLTVFAILRFVLLITVSGLKQDAWYLLAIGGLGMAQNVVAASAIRTPDSHGIGLVEIAHFEGTRVMPVLKQLEEYKAGVGASLLPIFFPGDLRQDEKTWWRAARRKAVGKPARSGKAVSTRILDGNTGHTIVWRRRRKCT
jgi:hypothetical protein